MTMRALRIRSLLILAGAILLGLAVQITGIMPFVMLVQLNVTKLPAVPWAIVPEMAIVGMLYLFLSGRLGPRAWAPALKRFLRFNPVPAQMVPQTAFTTFVFALTVVLLSLGGMMLTEFPPDMYAQFEAMRDLPTFTALAFLLGVAIFTGIVEETSYRGVMQVPLEERFGPVIAILVVAVVFAFSHNNLPLAVLPIFILGSCGWGVLVRITNSTIPGMIAHASIDGSLLLWMVYTPDHLHALLAMDVLSDGPNGLFVALVGALAVTASLTVWGFVRLAKLRRSEAALAAG